MNVTYACPQCSLRTQAGFDVPSRLLPCVHCGHAVAVPAGAVLEDQISRCLVCPSTELYVRKNFPQHLGIVIVVLGFVASCIPWYYHQWFATFAILFSTALVDVVLYVVMGNVLQCYRCHALYRDLAGIQHHQPFNLEVHERHRQQLARLKVSHVSHERRYGPSERI